MKISFFRTHPDTLEIAIAAPVGPAVHIGRIIEPNAPVPALELFRALGIREVRDILDAFERWKAGE